MVDELLNEAQKSLRIQEVYLRESKIFVRDDVFPESMDRSDTMTQGFRSFVRIRELNLANEGDDLELWNYRFNYAVGVRLILDSEEEESKADDYEPLIEIVGQFDASYLSLNELSEDQLMAFSQDNVGYHVWPYWREFVHSSCARIGYTPAFEVPFYQMTNKKEE
ncbi:hypothetical protein [Haliea sp.]|uniref:hypothetical protein n=1 Tax=Haliea sp. TaxID=1932666 RepID=UPI0035280316